MSGTGRTSGLGKESRINFSLFTFSLSFLHHHLPTLRVHLIMLLAKLFGSLLLAFAILFDRTPSVQLFTAQIYSDHLALYFSSALVASQTNAHQIMSTFCPYTCQAIIAALESSDEDKEFYEKVWPTLVFGTAPPVKEENWNFGYFLYLFVVIGAVIDTPRLVTNLLYTSSTD